MMRAPPPMYALLVGTSTYITFRGEHFDVTVPCRYLVLADANDDNFAIFVEYHNDENNELVKDTVLILVNGNIIKLEINGQVTVNMVPRSLPYIMNDLLSIRREHSIFKLQYKGRYFMDWHLLTDVTVFTSRQWARDNIIGILGKEEDELAEHFTLSHNNDGNDVENGTSRWRERWNNCQSSEIDSSNRSMTDDPKTIEIMSNVTECYGIFTSPESSLAKCYNIVNPEPYYNICINNENVCVSAQAYKKICEIRGAKGLSLPEKYATCRRTNQEKLPDSITAMNAADIVFMVEEVNSISFVDLSKLLLALDKALLSKGIGLDDPLGLKDLESTANRYAIVGWGGEMGLKDPFSRTFLANVWNSAQIAAELLTEIIFGDAKDIPRLNIVRVLEYASGFRFRKGASKILVLVQGQECQGQEKYDEITSVLNGNNFTLHILEPDSIKPKTIDPKPTKVLGVDMNGGYTAKHQDGAAPDPKLLSKISIPRDQCTPATFESGGSLFNLDRAEEARFAQIWAQRVALSAKKQTKEEKNNQIKKIHEQEHEFKAEAADDADMPLLNDISVEYEDESFI